MQLSQLLPQKTAVTQDTSKSSMSTPCRPTSFSLYTYVKETVSRKLNIRRDMQVPYFDSWLLFKPLTNTVTISTGSRFSEMNLTLSNFKNEVNEENVWGVSSHKIDNMPYQTHLYYLKGPEGSKKNYNITVCIFFDAIQRLFHPSSSCIGSFYKYNFSLRRQKSSQLYFTG